MVLRLNENNLSVHGRMSVAAVTHLLAEVLGTRCEGCGLTTEGDETVEITVRFSDGVSVDPRRLESYRAVISGIFALSRLGTPEIVIKFT